MSTTDRSGEKNFSCPMCGKSINLDADDTADEDGKVMHATCYFKRVGEHNFALPICHMCGNPCQPPDSLTNAKGQVLHRGCYRAALIEGRQSL